MMSENERAFCPGERIRVAGASQGPLRGLRFAAKDLYDVAGHVTGGGNPDWARTHPAAMKTAHTIKALLEAGAELVGKTMTDELAFSLEGRNLHYGTPVNPVARDRIPGGSSSGSASAVGSGLVDFALGTDTGGSVRIPATFCGICGFRPSHGALSLEGVIPLAPSFDTAGWLAEGAELLADVGDVLLPRAAPRELGEILLLEDVMEIADAEISDTFLAAMSRWQRIREPMERIRLETISGSSPEEWTEIMRILQGHEIARVHGPWIEAARPCFAPDIEARFAWARSISDEAAAVAGPRREAFARRLGELLEDGKVLCLPTAPTEAPALDAPPEDFRDFRRRTFIVTAIAGLARLPQVTLPASTRGSLPVGISLIAARGTDRALLVLARQLAEGLATE